MLGPSRRPSFTGSPMSKSRTMRLVATRPPASRQIRAAALSTGNPPPPARTCSERRHLHEREERGNGRRKRRRSNTRNYCDSILVKKLDGAAMPCNWPTLRSQQGPFALREDCGVRFRRDAATPPLLRLRAATLCTMATWLKIFDFLKVVARHSRGLPNLGCRNH